jgi:signal transduction histidine kinase
MADYIESLSILLIEDNPNDAMLVERYLRNAESALLPDSIQIHHEESLAPGLTALEDREIDLLLLDLGLPESEGIDTFDRVRSETTGVPVIVLTGLQDSQAAVDLVQEGAQDYLMKDRLDESRLVKSIRYALERQQQKSRLQTTNEQLEVLNRILRHDIRNDLQVQRLRFDSLREQLDGESEDLERVITANKHILDLTKNSKEYMDFIAGEEDVTRKPIRLDTLLEQELENARSTFEDAEFTVSGSLPPVSVYANEMLSSVFRNLFSNAVTHNDKETPTVEVDVTEQSGTVRVIVSDNGPGIPEDQQTDIFGKGSLGLDSPGTGIGLYLVQTLVSAYKGRVSVTDSEPTGAAFTIELEQAESDTNWASSV